MSSDLTSTSTVDLTVDNMGRANCSRLYRIRETIQMDPIYQRQGNIWSVSNKQLFIDSLLNGFDIPKIYFHDGQPVQPGKKYAIIDGKQRLEALFEFFDDKFPLSDRFEFFNVGEIASLGLEPEDLKKLAGKHYSQINREFPEVARVLDACPLSVVVVSTDDIEAIEEMFSRLNEAVPLNAAEKRQAIGDPMRTLVRDLAATSFFTATLPFSNRRYRHLDIASKFIRWALSVNENHSQTEYPPTKLDVKRAQLDRMFENAKSSVDPSPFIDASNLALETANAISERYHESDPLLSSVGTASLIFLDELTSRTTNGQSRSGIDRQVLVGFEQFRKDRENLDPKDADVIGALTIAEYNRLSQSPNDGSALTLRLAILRAYAGAIERGEHPLQALSRAELID